MIREQRARGPLKSVLRLILKPDCESPWQRYPPRPPRTNGRSNYGFYPPATGSPPRRGSNTADSSSAEGFVHPPAYAKLFEKKKNTKILLYHRERVPDKQLYVGSAVGHKQHCPGRPRDQGRYSPQYYKFPSETNRFGSRITTMFICCWLNEI